MDTIITRDGAELFYKDWGTGQPVLFSHAWPLNADMWDRQMRFLASRGYRCIAYDRRGFGRSSQPWDGYGQDVFADDLASLIHALDLIDTILVGCSMGGGDVVRYIARHGARRVDRIVLLGTFLPFALKSGDNPTGLDPSLFDVMQAAIAADRPEFLRKLHQSFFGIAGAGPSISEGMQQWTFGMSMQAGLPALSDCVTTFAETDFRQDLAGIDLPTLILHGGADQLAPVGATCRRAAGMIARSELIVIEGAPHGFWLTHHDQVNTSLLAFIGQPGCVPATMLMS